MQMDIKTYLNQKGIEYRQSGKELVAKCLFNGCDEDSRGPEAHLYFDVETSQYHCKKCDAKGNLKTLAKFFGDDLDEPKASPKPKTKFDSSLVETCHRQLPEEIKKYLNNRGLTDEIIAEHKLGYGEFYGRKWITIPIYDASGQPEFLKLRQDPKDSENPDKYKFYPMGSEATLYGWDTLRSEDGLVVITEGEFDRLVLLTVGVPAVCSTAGAGTFKREWVDSFAKLEKVVLAFDNDEQGQKGAERLTELLKEICPETSIYSVQWPDTMADKADVTDYFASHAGTPDGLLYDLVKQVGGPEPIDTSHFAPMGRKELIKVLGLTIKHDEVNKVITFLSQLTAYTENSQFNLSFNAPSSTGKSFIPTEIANLFPRQDVIELAYCSPTAFFHDTWQFDPEKKRYAVDLSRKIIVFLDQPHNGLLAHLRPLLSHDKKEICLKITDKAEKHGLRTKNVTLIGYPSVIFCTAGLKIDEQEATRFILLSPEITQEKIRESVSTIIRKEADQRAFKAELDADPERQLLMARIRAIKREGIQEINLLNQEEIEKRFLDGKLLKPRHQRDVKRLVSLIKAFALLNLWWRERDGKTITADGTDIVAAFDLWDEISVAQELNLPPYIYRLHQEVIVPLDKEKEAFAVLGASQGIERQEILQKHFEVYGRMLDPATLRQQILPMLETAGLVVQESDKDDKRKVLVHVIRPKTAKTGDGGQE